MEPLKEEALYEAFSTVKGKAKTLTPFVVPDFCPRPLKAGTDFCVRKKKAVELPRIDEKVTEDIDLNEVVPVQEEIEAVSEPVIESAPIEENIIVPEEQPVVEKKKAKASSSTKRNKKKSNKRRYDIDLIS